MPPLFFNANLSEGSFHVLFKPERAPCLSGEVLSHGFQIIKRGQFISSLHSPQLYYIDPITALWDNRCSLELHKATTIRIVRTTTMPSNLISIPEMNSSATNVLVLNQLNFFT